MIGFEAPHSVGVLMVAAPGARYTRSIYIQTDIYLDHGNIRLYVLNVLSTLMFSLRQKPPNRDSPKKVMTGW